MLDSTTKEKNLTGKSWILLTTKREEKICGLNDAQCQKFAGE
jgi:hypothetical protein